MKKSILLFSFSLLFSPLVWACETPPSIDTEFYDRYCMQDGLGAVSVKSRAKWGFADKSGKIQIPLQYDAASDFYNGMAWVKQRGKWFVINKQGEVLPEFPHYDYQNIWFETNGLIIVTQNNKKGIINQQGEIVAPIQYDSIWNFSEGLAAVQQNNKWGFIDHTGKLAIPIQYDWVENFEGDQVWVKSKGKWGIIDKQDNFILPPTYENKYSFSEGLAGVQQNNKWGFIDHTGKLIIPAKYGDAGGFSSHLANVQQNGKWGFIDKNANWVIPAQYDTAYSFNKNGLARVKLGKKWGVIDVQGNWVVPAKYDYIYLGDTYLIAQLKNKNGVVDLKGNLLLPIEYDSIGLKENLLEIYKNNKVGLFDPATQQIILPVEYSSIGDFIEGIAKVWKAGLAGYIDRTGKAVIPVKYDNISWFDQDRLLLQWKEEKQFFARLVNKKGEFVSKTYFRIDRPSEGMAKVCGQAFDQATKEAYIASEEYQQKDDLERTSALAARDIFSLLNEDKCSIINEKGEEILPFSPDRTSGDIRSFSQGLAAVRLEGEIKFIDKTGKIVLQDDMDDWDEWEDAGDFSEGLASVKKDGKWLVINLKGEEIISATDHQKIYPFVDGLALAKDKNGKYGVINKEGQWVIPARYDDWAQDEFLNGYIVLKRNGTYFKIDKQGNAVALPYESVSQIGDYLKVEQDDKYSIIGADNQIIFDLGSFFDHKVENFVGQRLVGQNGSTKNINGNFMFNGEIQHVLYDHETPVKLVAKMNGKFGIVDQEGLNITPFEFGYINDGFRDPLLRTEKKGKYGYINSRGQTVIPFKFTKAEDFSEGLAFVKQGNNKFFIDTTGKKVFSIPNKYGRYYTHFANKAIGVESSQNNKWGFLNKEGKLIIPTMYDKIIDRTPSNDCFAQVKKGEQTFYIDRKNQVCNP